MKTFVITWTYPLTPNLENTKIVNGITIINEENRREAIKKFNEYMEERECNNLVSIKTINKLNSRFGVVFNDTF